MSQRNIKGTLKWLIIPVLMLAGGGWAYYKGAVSWAWFSEMTERSAAESVEPLYFTMDPLVVNLVVGNSYRFLKAQPVIMTHSEAQLERLKTIMPRLRSEMIRLLREQDPQQVLSVNGYEAVRLDVLALVRQLASQKGWRASISDLYFTEFVVQ